MPDGTVEASVAGEWSLAETLRHLVLATDLWVGQAVLRAERPFHPLGLACRNPWAPERPETVLSCLHTVFEEEWEHHRYAVRDLDALAAGDVDVEDADAAPSTA
jgi:hypothetical protein